VSPERQWKFRVRHILDAIDKIARYTDGMSFDEFRVDDRTIDAVIRNFLVIGEASGHVPDSVREHFPAVPWKLMEGMRHVLVHDYDTVRLDIVWKTLTDDLPPLVEPLQVLVREP
jgi:uncharacterized protein with HEPN domain